MKLQHHHLLLTIFFATCFLFTTGLFAQTKTIEEVWTDMRPEKAFASGERPENGYAEYELFDNSTPLKGVLVFTFDRPRAELRVTFNGRHHVDPNGKPSGNHPGLEPNVSPWINPNGKPSSALHQHEMGGRSPVVFEAFQSESSQNKNIDPNAQGYLDFTLVELVNLKEEKFHFHFSIPDDLDLIKMSGTVTYNGQEEPISLRRRTRR